MIGRDCSDGPGGGPGNGPGDPDAGKGDIDCRLLDSIGGKAPSEIGGYGKCNGDVSYDEGSLQEVRTVTMTMTDVECLRLI